MTLDDLLLLVMVLGALWAVRVWIGDQVQRLIRVLRTPPIRESARRAWRASAPEDLSSVSAPPPAPIMSNAAPPPAQIPGVLGTDGRTDGRTPSTTAIRDISTEVMLDILRVFRQAEVRRDDARALLSRAQIRFSNDLWTQAAPPPKVRTATPEPETVTPVANRQTDARFYDYDDPALNYRPLGRDE